MALTKCPRCELNYILDGGALCTVCRREVRGEPEIHDMPEMCSECGEHPVMPGSELCVFCMKEMNRRVAASADAMEPEATTIELDGGVSSMNEIELDIDDELESPFGDEDFRDDDDVDDEDGDLSIDVLREQDDMDEEEEE